MNLPQDLMPPVYCSCGCGKVMVPVRGTLSENLVAFNCCGVGQDSDNPPTSDHVVQTIAGVPAVNAVRISPGRAPVR